MSYEKTAESRSSFRVRPALRLFTDPAQRITILLVTAALVVFSSSGIISEYFSPSNFEIGEIATRTVRAPRDLFVEDALNTERQRSDAERAVRRVFEHDDVDFINTTKPLRMLFESINAFSSDPSDATKGKIALEPQERMQLEKSLDLSFTEKEWEVLEDRSLWPILEQIARRLVHPILHKGIISDKAPLESVLSRSGATLINKESGLEQTILNESVIYDEKEADQVFESLIPASGYKRGEEFDSLVRKLGTYLLKPNVRFDRERTADRLKVAREGVEPVYYQIRRGETIVRAGDRVSPSQEGKLTRLSDLQGTKSLLVGMFSFYVLCCTILFVLYSFAARSLQGFKPAPSELLALALVFLGSIFLERLGVLLGSSLSFSFPDVDPGSFALVAPLATGGILLQAILGPAYVVYFVISFALLTGLVQEDAWLKLILICIGNFVGTLAIQKTSRRSAFLSASLRVALINVLLTLCYVVLFPQFGASSAAAAILSASIGGLLAGVIAASLLPVFEFAGGYVTAMKLLELASLDRPLLRELSLQAPGTWNHSIVMGQLGEVAAEAIGANPLLTRVGAYYHDIGKAKKPLYFVENQPSRDNRHDRLTPSMSALIIRAHVKDGIEMGKAARLPAPLLDFIPQHHGTALIEYFYDKALKDAEPGEVIDENLFRYPGPKPQTKEAGILMLADQVEAISRTIADPTPAKIQGMVQKVINRVFASGQLDESELTLKDLHYIAKSFSRVLTGIVHRRIEYPEPTDRGTQKPESAQAPLIATEETPKRTAELPNTHEKNGLKRAEPSTEKPAQAETKETLKRLGI